MICPLRKTGVRDVECTPECQLFIKDGVVGGGNCCLVVIAKCCCVIGQGLDDKPVVGEIKSK